MSVSGLSRKSSGVAFLFLFLAALSARGMAKTDAEFHYLDPAQVDLTVWLPPPPDLGSAQERNDEEKVADEVAARNPSQLAREKAASERSVFFFAGSLGPQFNPSRFPVTDLFFARVESDVEKLVDLAKTYWKRPRPNGAVKNRGSYPSGHAAFAASAAIVLAQLVPCKREQIFAQARTFAENRIVLGLHYPSDVAAGWTAGTLAVFAMMHDPAFARDFSATKAELQKECPPAPFSGAARFRPRRRAKSATVR
ncbi:MAG: phosphatase PAP2 family protein [Candidatus Cybelea sp.]